MAGGKEEYNAFFYSLVSTDTQVEIYPLFLDVVWRSNLYPLLV